eukprot:NODE_1439_length_914_cov_303.380347_g1111_i0.p1 GENE.NODE_1439_length_914_cov_303.380347_g1111_i0~~NODE_1439_length_914_cov_303.380347_g1111_i0.p1  ORF type:complete len:179 (-),score=27.99 NODE_1439_length_914_cov_303.380347_g1111_i0:96-632(-)
MGHFLSVYFFFASSAMKVLCLLLLSLAVNGDTILNNYLQSGDCPKAVDMCEDEVYALYRAYAQTPPDWDTFFPLISNDAILGNAWALPGAPAGGPLYSYGFDAVKTALLMGGEGVTKYTYNYDVPFSGRNFTTSITAKLGLASGDVVDIIEAHRGSTTKDCKINFWAHSTLGYPSEAP